MLDLVLWSLAIVFGTIFLIKGSDILVESGGRTARYLGVPVIIVGLTLVSFGTSLPELAASLNASLLNQTGISLGNVIGSNISNTLLVVGVAALIKPIEIDDSILKRELPIMFIAFLGFLLVLFVGEKIIRIEGIFLLFLFVLYLAFFTRIALKSEKRDGIEEEIAQEKYVEINNFDLKKESIKLIVGFIGVVIGSQMLISGSVFYMETFNLNQGMVGLSIVAIATSLPEMVATSLAAFKEEADISLGNVIGSNAFNILLVVGVCSMFVPLEVASEIIFYSLIMVIAALILVFFIYVGEKITRIEGLVLSILYFIFLYSLSIFF